MIRSARFAFFAALSLCASLACAQQADLVLTNGKIVTVDDRFTIAQALAIRGQRIVAVGSNADVRKFAGTDARVMDLRGRTVIPGLIDNHAHFVRVAEKWHSEMRLDEITSRRQVIAMLQERVKTTRPATWIVALGGWSEEQFTDDPRGFSLAELDQIAPNHPVVLQAIYRHTYVNSAAMKAAGIDEKTADPQGGRIEKDANGRPTGLVSGAGGVAFVAAKVPLADKEQWRVNARNVVRYLNSVGMTAWMDAGGRGMSDEHYAPYRELAERGELNVRIYWQTITREQALIAHTRNNGYVVFQESNLGSLQPGKYADLLVLDRDYLTIPADQIKDIKPVMTMVGGKIVYEAK